MGDEAGWPLNIEIVSKESQALAHSGAALPELIDRSLIRKRKQSRSMFFTAIRAWMLKKYLAGPPTLHQIFRASNVSEQHRIRLSPDFEALKIVKGSVGGRGERRPLAVITASTRSPNLEKFLGAWSGLGSAGSQGQHHKQDPSLGTECNRWEETLDSFSLPWVTSSSLGSKIPHSEQSK